MIVCGATQSASTYVEAVFPILYQKTGKKLGKSRVREEWDVIQSPRKIEEADADNAYKFLVTKKSSVEGVLQTGEPRRSWRDLENAVNRIFHREESVRIMILIDDNTELMTSSARNLQITCRKFFFSSLCVRMTLEA